MGTLTTILLLLQIIGGVVYALVLEWWIHKNILHHPKWGKKKGALFSFHFQGHHGESRRNDFYDPDYIKAKWTAENTSLVVFFIPHLLVAYHVPVFVGTIVIMTIRYYILHQTMHKDPEWTKKHMPWHYDHHMAPNQDSNYGVTTDIIDRLMGTREVYYGTKKWEQDEKRRHRARMRKKLQIL